MKPYPVAYAKKPAVEAEIERLIKDKLLYQLILVNGQLLSFPLKRLMEAYDYVATSNVR